MTQAAVFTTAHKNALLNCLTGKAATLAIATIGKFTSPYSNSHLMVYSSSYGDATAVLGTVVPNLCSVANWGTAIAGTVPFAMNWMPNASADAVWARWVLYDPTAQATWVDGRVSVAGGGGMLITPSVAFVSGVTEQLTATFKMPLNNGSTLRLNKALANALLTTLIHDTNQPLLCDGGTLSIYDGTQPATGDTAVTTQTLLCNSYSLAVGTYALAAGGTAVLAANITTVGNAVSTGTATWFRFTKGSLVLDGSVGVAGSGCDAIVASTAFISGTPASLVSALDLTFP